MKKKLLIVLGSLVAILGIVYLSGYFDGGKPTAADEVQGEATHDAVDSILAEPGDIIMPEVDSSPEIEVEEKFNDNDPAAML